MAKFPSFYMLVVVYLRLLSQPATSLWAYQAATKEVEGRLGIIKKCALQSDFLLPVKLTRSAAFMY